MRPVAVVVLDILLKHEAQVPLVDDQEPVETFAAERTDPPFGVVVVLDRHEHADVDITAWHIGPAQPGDLTYPGGQVFYIDGNVVNGVTNLPDFLGDFVGIPAEPGHYSFHPVAGVAGVFQVAFRPAK